MVSIDVRIKRAARRSSERWNLLASVDMIGLPGTDALRELQRRHDLEELREFLAAEAYYMLGRVAAEQGFYGYVTLDQRRIIVKRVHMLTYDDTYHDYAPSTKQYRTRERIEALLELCRGDEQLLLDEYARAIEHVFPVSLWSDYFVWSPRLIVRPLDSGRLRKTIRFHMKRRPRP